MIAPGAASPQIYRDEARCALYRKAVYLANPDGKWVVHRRYDIPKDEYYPIMHHLGGLGYRVHRVGGHDVSPDFVKLSVKNIPREEWEHFHRVYQRRKYMPFLWKAMYDVMEDVSVSGKDDVSLNISRVARNFGAVITLFDVSDYIVPFINKLAVRGKAFDVTSYGSAFTNDRIVRLNVIDNPEIHNTARWYWYPVDTQLEL